MHAIVLKYFVEVARCGSIRKAAQNLFVASSAVNRQILKLEDELGVELFDRLPNGIRLNPSGERILQHIRTTLHDFQLLRTELDAIKGVRTGHVSVVAMDSLFIDFLPTAIEEFSDFFPAVTYSILAESLSVVPELVATGDYDVGISFINKLPTGVEVVASAALPPGIVMASSHPLASREIIEYEDCAGYIFLTSGEKSPFHDIASPGHSRFWDSISAGIRCNSTPMLKRLILAGKGLAIFSKVGFMKEIESGEIVWRPLPEAEINKTKVGIFIPKQRALPHVTQQFIARQVSRLKQLELASKLY